MPTVEEIFEDPPELPSDYSERDSEAEFEEKDPPDNPDEIGPGDRVFMTTVHDPAEFTGPQLPLHNALRRPSPGTPHSEVIRESVPSQFHDFEDVFSKASFDALPDRKPWDHAI